MPLRHELPATHVDPTSLNAAGTHRPSFLRSAIAAPGLLRFAGDRLLPGLVRMQPMTARWARSAERLPPTIVPPTQQTQLPVDVATLNSNSCEYLLHEPDASRPANIECCLKSTNDVSWGSPPSGDVF